MATRRNRKSNSVSVDFTGVETRGRFHEDGDYHLRVKSVSREEGRQKDDYLSWEIECANGDSEGAICYNNTSLSKQSLWNLAAFLTALGMEVPDSEYDLDLEECEGLEFMGTIEMEKWEGKPRPRLVDFWAISDKDKDDGKDDRGGRRRSRDDKDDKDDKSERSSRRSSRGGKEKEDDDKGEDADLSQDSINDMSEEELEDVIKDNKLKVDLSDFSTLRKMRAAVIDACEDKGLLSEGGDSKDEPEDKDDRRSSSRSRGRDRDDGDKDDGSSRRSRRSRR